MQTDQDQHLIERTLDGDTNAFAQLVKKYQKMVYTVAFRMMKTHENAEEVAQDAFVSAFTNLKKFKKQSKFSTWLYRITYNKALDHLKLDKSNAFVELDVVESHGATFDDGILESIDREDRRQIIKDALKELSPKDNALILFFYFEELSLKEISKITGLKENAIKVRLYRSRQQLEAILSQRLAPETLKRYEKR